MALRDIALMFPLGVAFEFNFRFSYISLQSVQCQYVFNRTELQGFLSSKSHDVINLISLNVHMFTSYCIMFALQQSVTSKNT